MDPKTMMIPVTLKGANYLLWSRIIKTTLRSEGLDSHLTTSEAPSTVQQESKEVVSANELKWLQEDSKVLSIIQFSLDESILEAYSYCETAKELWETLNKVYGNTSNLIRVFEVKKAINRRQNGIEFTHYFGKFRSLWAELEELRPNTTDPIILNERKEQDKVFGLLLNLDPVYNDLIKHILRADKLPSLEEVCSHIQKEQGSLALFGGKRELSYGHMAESVTKVTTQSIDHSIVLTCEICRKKGHKKSKCWTLHPHMKPNKFKDAKAHPTKGRKDKPFLPKRKMMSSSRNLILRLSSNP